MSESVRPSAREARSVLPPAVAAVAAWAVPGLGHALLGRRGRGLFFAVLVLAALAIGCQLHGNLSTVLSGQPLAVLRTLGCMGMGLPYVGLRWAFAYQGDLLAPGYEYGSAFLLSAGLMNLLLVLDAWDIASGRKQ